MKSGHSIDDILKPLAEEQTQCYLCDIMQVADVIDWVLEQVGKSIIVQTSFSICEEALRRMHTIRKRGLVSELYLVLDYKATNKTLSLWPFLLNTADGVYLANNHSKVILIKGEDGRKVTIITSQNLTRGNKNEATFITSDPTIFKKMSNEISGMIQDGTVNLSDIYKEKIDSYARNTLVGSTEDIGEV